MNLFKGCFREKKLVIFDDIYPNILTGFRIAEYNYYLQKIKNCEVYSSTSQFYDLKNDYAVYYPDLADRISFFDENRKYEASLFYTVFLNNIYSFLPVIEASQKPFVFTLYPGGGLGLDDQESDIKLKAVFESSLFRRVIVTQKNIYDYLLKKRLCPKSQIEFIYGGVVPSDFFMRNSQKKQYYKKNKETLDICFVANKYMERGIDKGYHIFVEVANQLCLISPDIRFHVVGNFSPEDINLGNMKEKTTFYNVQKRDFFPEFYAYMDIILSPNLPFKLHAGSFDGFPTGCCVEAGLSGVAVFCTDELQLNDYFKDRDELCIISTKVDEIVDIVKYYLFNLDSLYKLSANCQKKFYHTFDIKAQTQKRIKILNRYL